MGVVTYDTRTVVLPSSSSKVTEYFWCRYSATVASSVNKLMDGHYNY